MLPHGMTRGIANIRGRRTAQAARELAGCRVEELLMYSDQQLLKKWKRRLLSVSPAMESDSGIRKTGKGANR